MGEIMRAQTQLVLDAGSALNVPSCLFGCEGLVGGLLERGIPALGEVGESRTGRMATTPDLDDPGAGGARVRLLFPYSGSPTADAAVDVAADWAQALCAEVWVLYVRPWDTCRGGHYFVETPAEARAQTQEAVGRLRMQGVSASGVVRDADRARLADMILAEADALDARMIVLGTHARGALRSALLGSTSLTVARRATRPVILVKAVRKSRPL